MQQAIVVAGATRNQVDAVRFLSAHSTGSTGVALGRALAQGGVAVHLLGSPETLLRGPELQGEPFGSTRDLMARLERRVRANPAAAVVLAAAVGDYELAAQEAGKIPSGAPTLTLTLTPTPKIADRVRGWGAVGPFWTFKAAPPGTPLDRLEAIASAQRQRTGCDWVFANTLGALGVDVLLVGEQVLHFPHRGEAIAATARLLLAAR
ncbi:MAG: hypothetical protein JXX28_13300 [Deltaproteobacteria bacterium]|nr:hypothetical protein [Deltaproteobacteria bacterium]